MYRVIGVLICLLMFSCSSPVAEYPALDLMKHGLPIKIQAPEGAVVEMTDYGFMKDLTVKKGSAYYLQITSSEVIQMDISKLVAEKLLEVKSKDSFSKILEENPGGFIFEKTRIDSSKNYDFRYMKIQGDRQYLFQTGLIGKYTEEEARSMFNSVQ